MKRKIPNYMIENEIRLLNSFINYNSTITAEIDKTNGQYRIMHWNTLILSYDIENKKIVGLASEYISQTTSALVGKILRGLPKEAVKNYLTTYRLSGGSSYDLNRLVKMAGVDY